MNLSLLTISRRLVLGACLALAAALPLAANPAFTFGDQDCACVLPDGWVQKPATDSHFLLAATNSDASKSFVLAVEPVPPGLDVTDSGLIRRQVQACAGSDVQMVPTGMDIIDGTKCLIFSSIMQRPDGPVYGCVYLAVANGYIYYLDMSSASPGAGSDPELVSIARAFRFSATVVSG